MHNKFIKDYFVTLISQILVLVAGIIILKIISLKLEKEGLGAYIIIRRFVGLIFPLVTINLGLSLQRYAIIKKQKSDNLLFIAIFIVHIINFFFIVIVLLFKNTISSALFGNNNFNDLILPMLFLLYATSLQLIFAGYFRGKKDFNTAAFLDILYWLIAIIFLFLLFVKEYNDSDFLSVYFLYYSAFSIIVSGIVFIKKYKIQSKFREILKLNFDYKNINEEKDFLLYGLKRLPLGFLFSGIFFTPILVATNYLSLKDAAYIGIIISIVRLMQIFAFSFNLIFIPKFAEYKDQKKEQMIKKSSQLILDSFFTLPLLFSTYLFFFSEEIILLWFGNKYEIVIKYLTYVAPFIGFFIQFVLIRGVLDGLYRYPFANYITAFALFGVVIVSILTSIYNWKLMGLTISVIIGLIILGISSMRILILKQNLTIFTGKNFIALFWYMFLLILFALFNQYINYYLLHYQIFAKILFSALIFLISIWIYRKLKFGWISEIIQRIKVN